MARRPLQRLPIGVIAGGRGIQLPPSHFLLGLARSVATFAIDILWQAPLGLDHAGWGQHAGLSLFYFLLYLRPNLAECILGTLGGFLPT